MASTYETHTHTPTHTSKMASTYETQFPALGQSARMPRNTRTPQPPSQPPSKEKIAKSQNIYDYLLKMFKQPFRYINYEYKSQYSFINMFRPLIGQPETYKDGKNFHEKIKYFLWCEEGQNDKKPWLLLCQLRNGKYAYYTAYCDYTGFDCQGGMALYIASTPEILVEMAMTDAERAKYTSFLKRKAGGNRGRKLTLGDFIPK